MKSECFVRVPVRVCPAVVRYGVAAFLILFVTTMAWSQQSAGTQLSKAALAALRTPPQVVTGAATLTGHYTASPKLRLTIALRPPNPEQEAEFLREIQDKTSPQYHQFLSPANWITRFSPSEQDEQAVIDWATTQGFTVTHRFPNRLLVDVEAPVSAIETALGVTINSYSLNGASYFSNDRDPVLPASVANIITSVQGLNNIQRMQTRKSAVTLPEPDYVPGPVVAMGTSVHRNGSRAALKAALAAKAKQAKASGKSANSNITNGNYDPTDIYNSNAYNYNALQALGHCCNPENNSSGSPPQASIALAAFGAFADTDITGFGDQYPYLAYNIQPIYIDGTPACCGDEVTLDSEWSMATSNSFGSYIDTAEVFTYEGANEDNGTFTDIYNQMVSDSYARVFSTSWSCTEFYGCDSGTMDSRDAIFSEMVGEGWTLMAASGDRGATDDCSDRIDVSFPASDPNVIGVGGTYLQLFSNSTYDYEVGWQGGTASGSCGSNNGGSGGGCSAYYAAPGYQSSPACGSGSRSTPDISLNAAHGQNYFYSGSLQGVGGTSISSPMVAGFMAQADAYLLSLGNICGVDNGTLPCAPMGNANYNIYYEGYNSGYAPHYPFYDITSGCNSNDITAFYGLGYYCAGVGYDDVTGWGTFNALQFAWMINYSTAADIGAPYVTFGGPTTGKWYNTDQFIDWDVTDTGGGYPATGVSGFSQAWDADPGDVFSEATPGQGNSFYSGPQYPNATFGCVDLSGALCSGGAVSQGCHTINVRGWDNMGLGTGDYTYGPVCYDTVAPHTTAKLTGTLSGGTYTTAVKVTLTATDPSPGSGVASTVYQVNGGTVTTYTAPFTVSTAGVNTITFHSTDVAGNVEGTETASFSITSATSTVVSSSLNPSASGESVKFTATVTATLSGTPTGTVLFKNGTTNLGTKTLSGGVAELTTKILTVGSHSITATYNGATYFVGGTSSALTQVVKNATTTTLVSALNPSEFGQTVKFTATIASSAGTPAGTVTFKYGTTVLGTKTLSGGAASLSVSTLTVATHSITADYSGNATFAASASTVLHQVVTKAASKTTLVSSANPSTSGETVTFTATVKSTTTGTPAGTVNFMDGTTKLGSRTLSAGVAAFPTSTLSTGTHQITAVYVGNGDYTTSTSAVLSQKVNP